MKGVGENKTLPNKWERNKKNFGHRRRIVAIEVIVKPVVVPVPPVIVPVQIPDIQVASGIAVVYRKPSKSLPFECSQGCIVFGIVMP